MYIIWHTILLIPKLQKIISTISVSKQFLEFILMPWSVTVSTLRDWDTKLSYRQRSCDYLQENVGNCLWSRIWHLLQIHNRNKITAQFSVVDIPASKQNKNAGLAILNQTRGPPDPVPFPRLIVSWTERYWLCLKPPMIQIKYTCIIVNKITNVIRGDNILYH